jgi:hypothetical protein
VEGDTQEMNIDTKSNVYVLTYLPTGRKYVGKTVYNDNGKMRLHLHLYKLQHGTHTSKQFQADFNKYGGEKENFKMEFVDDVWLSERFNSRPFDTEKIWMLKLKTYDNKYGYNSQDPSMKRWMRKCRMYQARAI